MEQKVLQIINLTRSYGRTYYEAMLASDIGDMELSNEMWKEASEILLAIVELTKEQKNEQ